MSTEPTLSLLFADGSMRPVFEDADGRQYVYDDDDERVYGVWLAPQAESDAPAVVVDERGEGAAGRRSAGSWRMVRAQGISCLRRRDVRAVIRLPRTSLMYCLGDGMLGEEKMYR